MLVRTAHFHPLCSNTAMALPEPARGYLTGVANNPRSGWLEYFGCAPPQGASPPLAFPPKALPELAQAAGGH